MRDEIPQWAREKARDVRSSSTATTRDGWEAAIAHALVDTRYDAYIDGLQDALGAVTNGGDIEVVQRKLRVAERVRENWRRG